MDLRDLSPQKDPKGGSPKSPPVGIPVRSVEEYTPQQTFIESHNGTALKIYAAAVTGICITAFGGWITAVAVKDNRGVSHEEMEKFVISQDRIIEDHVRENTEKIASQNTRIDRNGADIISLQNYNVLDTRDKESMKASEKFMADTLENLRKGQK